MYMNVVFPDNLSDFLSFINIENIHSVSNESAEYR